MAIIAQPPIAELSIIWGWAIIAIMTGQTVGMDPAPRHGWRGQGQGQDARAEWTRPQLPKKLDKTRALP
jgi:hypothetical protein